MPTGAAPILGVISALEESGIELTVLRTLNEDDLVVFHVTYEDAQAFGADTLAGFDVYRVEDGQVAEHWDNLVPLAAPNPSGRTQTDGVTEVVDERLIGPHKLRRSDDPFMANDDEVEVVLFEKQIGHAEREPGGRRLR